jgi:hypothetical protein
MYPPSRAKGRREQSHLRRSSLKFFKLSSRQLTAPQSAMSEGQIERYKSHELASPIASSASLIWNIQVLRNVGFVKSSKRLCSNEMWRKTNVF